MTAIRVYEARRVVTMDPTQPEATHVAVRDGRILGAGGAELLGFYPGAEADARFAAKVIVPGFVEGHSHAAEGMVWRLPYLGYFDRTMPDGGTAPGVRTLADALARLRALEAALKPGEPLMVWGFDPIYYEGPRLHRRDLDAISATRPIVVSHASGHIINVNSMVLERAGFSADSNLDGLLRDDNGLTGELMGPPAMQRATRVAGGGGLMQRLDEEGLRAFARQAARVGITTATDLQRKLDAETVDMMRRVTGSADFPMRLVAALGAREYSVADGVARAKELLGTGAEKLHFGIVKLTLDGSIQGFTGRLRWPGYHNGAPNGMWYIAPSELPGIVEAYLRAGAQIHIHTNGDEASETAIGALEQVLAGFPRPEHRTTLQHCQMADAAQFRRMAALGMAANLFANHLYFWGEQHAALTAGPVRAPRMNATATARREGVPIAIHSDAPVTPLGPLFSMWCAVNRLTSAGRVFGAEERLSVMQALHAVTLGPAWTLKLDHDIGSIAPGKFADFAVLDEDPFLVTPGRLREIGVHATVVAGEVCAR
jgi:predicted amidohydrolase YtcJ